MWIACALIDKSRYWVSIVSFTGMYIAADLYEFSSTGCNKRIVNCLVAPCRVSTCPKYPNAVCRWEQVIVFTVSARVCACVGCDTCPSIKFKRILWFRKRTKMWEFRTRHRAYTCRHSSKISQMISYSVLWGQSVQLLRKYTTVHTTVRQ